MKPKQLITPASLTNPSRNLNNMCDMDVEECIMIPMPIVEIKDEDDCVPQINMPLPLRLSDEDKINEWNAEINKDIKRQLVVCNSEKDFEDMLEKYVRKLDDTNSFKRKSMLKAKVLFHLSSFHIMFCCLSKKLVGICTTSYLDYIEEIVVFYCNLELQVVRNWKSNQIGGEHTIAKKVAQKLINTLCVNLMNNQKRIFHVLLRLNYEHELHCKEIMNTVYKHFLINHPVKDSSDLSYCRYYLLFEKWKSLNDKKDHKKIDDILLLMFKNSSESLQQSAAFKEIWPSSSSSSVVNVVDALVNGLKTFIKNYFIYIGKPCEDDELHIPRGIDSEEEENEAPRSLFDVSDIEKVPNNTIKTEKNIPTTRTRRIAKVLPNINEVCIIDDDSDIEEVIIVSDKKANTQLRITIPDIASTLDEMSMSRPSSLVSPTEAVLPISTSIESVHKSTENVENSCSGLEESFERTSLVDSFGEPSALNSVSDDLGAPSKVNLVADNSDAPNCNSVSDTNKSDKCIEKDNLQGDICNNFDESMCNSLDVSIENVDKGDMDYLQANSDASICNSLSVANECVEQNNLQEDICNNFDESMCNSLSVANECVEQNNLQDVCNNFDESMCNSLNASIENVEKGDVDYLQANSDASICNSLSVANECVEQNNLQEDICNNFHECMCNSVSVSNESNKTVEKNSTDDNSQMDCRNNVIIEMHVEGTGGINDKCGFCHDYHDSNENSETDEVSSAKSKRSVSVVYFCGIESPPSDENCPTTMENSSTKRYSYVPGITSFEEDFYIETNNENLNLQINPTPPNDSQNAKETETSNSTSFDVQEEENLTIDKSLVNIEETLVIQASLNEIETEIANESNESHKELNVTQVEDTETGVDNFEMVEAFVEAQTETPLEKPADENESNETSVEVEVPEKPVDETSQNIDVEESFDDNLVQTPLSIEEEETSEVVYTESTAKQIIEMVKEIELEEKEASASEVSVNVNPPENELNQQRPEYQQHIYMPDINLHEYQLITPVNQNRTLNKNRRSHATNANEEYQIVKSIRESCAALHKNNYCLNNIPTTSNNVPSSTVTAPSQPLQMGCGIDIMPLVLNNNLMSDRQEVIYPKRNAKDNSTKITLSTTPVEIHNKYIYTPPPVSTHLHASILNPIMNNSLSEFENFHQKHNSLMMDPNTKNCTTQSHKIQASVTMQPLVESSKKTNGILKTSKRRASNNRILYTDNEHARSFPSEWFENFQQSKREIIESESGPVNSLISNKSNYINYDDSGVSDNFLYNNVSLNNTREQCSPVSPAYEQIHANEYKNHILKVSMENSMLNSENTLRKKLNRRSSIQMYDVEHAKNTVMQNTKNGLNNSRVNEVPMPYKSSLAKGGLKRQRSSNEPNKKPKITFSQHVETHLVPREEDYLRMADYIKDPGTSKSVSKARVRKYPPVPNESANKINIVTSESMAEYNVSSKDRRLFTDVPCVEVKLDTNSEIRQKIDQQTLKCKLDSVMKRKKLESENTCIQSRIDYIKPEDTSVLHRHTENVTPTYHNYFGYPGINYLAYSSSSLPPGYTNPALRGLKRDQLNNESTEDNTNNNTDSHLTVKTRRRSISEANEVNVVNTPFSKKTRRRNGTTKLPIVETTKRRAGRPKKTETTKSTASKTSTGVLYSDGPFRLG